VQGRFGAKLVEPGPYLLRLNRYVHLNPVCVQAREELDWPERVEILRKYGWSSYGGYIGKGPELDFVNYAPILDLVEGPPKSDGNATGNMWRQDWWKRMKNCWHDEAGAAMRGGEAVPKRGRTQVRCLVG
jgi:hypothetical protein